MMLPIEAGCLAVIINSNAGNTGIFVTVGEFVGVLEGWHGGQRWEIDKILPSTHGILEATTMRESQLMRIDGGNFEVEQESKEKVND